MHSSDSGIKDWRTTQVIIKTIRKNKKYKLSNQSALISYYLLLSIGPFLVLTFGILSRVLADNIDSVVRFFNRLYEDSDMIVQPILEYLGQSSNSAFAFIGLVGTLFSSSKASRHLLLTFHEIFSQEESEGIKESIKFVLLSMAYTVALILSLIIFFILFVTGDPIAYVVDYLFNIDLTNYALWGFVKNVLPVIYLFLFLTAMYKVIPQINDGIEMKYQNTFIGSIFVTIGWIIGSLIFSFYIKNINEKNAIYGALGSIMVLMLWFFLLIYILLLGGALIKSCMEVREERMKKQEKIENNKRLIAEKQNEKGR